MFVHYALCRQRIITGRLAYSFFDLSNRTPYVAHNPLLSSPPRRFVRSTFHLLGSDCVSPSRSVENEVCGKAYAYARKNPRQCFRVLPPDIYEMLIPPYLVCRRLDPDLSSRFGNVKDAVAAHSSPGSHPCLHSEGLAN